MTYTVKIPLAVVNVSNERAAHWGGRKKRVALHRGAAHMALLPFVRKPWAFPLLVTLTRIAPRELDDDGNVTAMKPLRDGVADALKLPNDKDPRVTFVCRQERGGVRETAVRIDVTPRASCPSCGSPVARVDH